MSSKKTCPSNVTVPVTINLFFSILYILQLSKLFLKTDIPSCFATILHIFVFCDHNDIQLRANKQKSQDGHVSYKNKIKVHLSADKTSQLRVIIFTIIETLRNL